MYLHSLNNNYSYIYIRFVVHKNNKTVNYVCTSRKFTFFYTQESKEKRFHFVTIKVHLTFKADVLFCYYYFMLPSGFTFFLNFFYSLVSSIYQELVGSDFLFIQLATGWFFLSLSFVLKITIFLDFFIFLWFV